MNISPKCILLKNDILIIVIFVCFIWIIIQGYRSKLIHSDRENLKLIGNCLKLYIHQNKGSFPPGEEDMISKGFIKVSCENNDKKYSLRVFPESNGWVDGVEIDRYYIHYGIKVENLIAKERKLFDRNTGAQILLIECRFIKDNWRKKRLRKICESISYELYEKMVKRRKKFDPISVD